MSETIRLYVNMLFHIACVHVCKLTVVTLFVVYLSETTHH